MSDWNSPKMRRAIRRHDRKAHKARKGQRYNSPPRKTGGCALTVGAVAVGLLAVRKDYGPQGACGPKAAVLVAIPVLLVRLVARKARGSR